MRNQIKSNQEDMYLRWKLPNYIPSKIDATFEPKDTIKCIQREYKQY